MPAVIVVMHTSAFHGRYLLTKEFRLIVAFVVHVAIIVLLSEKSKSLFFVLFVIRCNPQF